MAWVHREFSGTAGEDGDGSLVYEPVRLTDGRVAIEASLAELKPLLDAHHKQALMLRLMPRRRRWFVDTALAMARSGWERQNG